MGRKVHCTAMRIAVVFDTPYQNAADHDAHVRRMNKELREHPEPEVEYQVGQALLDLGHEVLLVGVRDDLGVMVEQLGEWKPDLVFNLTEAHRGREELDYVVPGVLEAEGYRYTGAPPLALLITRNKALSKKVLAYHGILVPGFATYRLHDEVGVAPSLRFPLIVKPLQSDASAGIAQASVVWEVEGLRERVGFIHERFTQPAIAEEFVEGRELYVGVVGPDDDPEILPPTEMVFDKGKTRPEERIATEAAKWQLAYRERKGIRNVFARRIAKGVKARIDEVCRAAYRALWLHDYARFDLRLTPTGEVWMIEANANPFISDGHDMANMAWKAGMDYRAFIDRIVREARRRYGRA